VITTWILEIGGNFFHWLLGLLPTITAPSWLTDNNGAMTTVFTDAGLMGVWFPSTLLISALLGLLVILATGFGIKVVRVVASFFTAGGGSAG
jgi:hypothetical protein